MKRLIKFGSIGLVIAGAIAIGGEAFAQIPPISRYSQIDSTTGATTGIYVRITGTPRTQVPVTIAGQPQTTTKQVRLNSCGFGTIDATNIQTIAFSQSNGSSTYTVGPTEIPTATSPIPTCVNGNSSLDNITAGAAPVVINLGGGKILINALKFPNNQGRVIDVAITKTVSKEKFVTLNVCGVGQISLGADTIPAEATIAVNGGTPTQINGLPNGNTVPVVDCAGSALAVNVGIPAGATFKNAAGDFFIKSASSGITLPTGATTTKSVTSDRCGGITVGSITNPQTTPFTLNGTTIDPIDPATLTTGLKPNCKLGTGGDYAYDVAPSGISKLSDGRVFVATTTANPTGFGDRLIYTMNFTASATAKTYNSDACGVIRVKQTTPAFTEITVDGNPYVMADLQTREFNCKRTAAGAIPYATN